MKQIINREEFLRQLQSMIPELAKREIIEQSKSLIFKDGKVVEAKASKGQNLLLQLLETDEGARYVGEIAVGTNHNITQFTKNMLFDEKIGGTIHLAIGRSLPESGGVNKSSIHWDMVCDMKDGGEIYADDELIYKNGKFIIV